MHRFLRVIEIMWLAIAAVSLVEAVFRWNEDRNKALIFIAFMGLAVFMFFFRRKSRQKLEAKMRDKQNDN